MDVRQGFDTRSVAERILLVAGSLLLILGPALQAITEIREYGELLDALDAADVPGVALEGLKLSLANAFPFRPFSYFLAVIPWAIRFRAALDAFSKSAAAGNAQAVRIAAGLARARNWAVVLLGSLLLLAASTISLIHWLTTNPHT
jgi:hypothetical protein